MKKIYSVIFLLFLSTTMENVAALAQDPLEVSPQIYKKLFENERVRVLEAVIPPGGATAEHSHPDHLAYVVSGSKIRLTHPDGSVKEVEPKAGDVIWVPAETHASKNIGDSEFKVIVVELK